MFCSSCGAQISSKGRFCSSCGAPIELDKAATVTGDDPTLSAGGEGETLPPPPPPATPASRKIPAPRISAPRTPSASPLPLSSSDPIGGGRFVPGQIIAERYRIV